MTIALSINGTPQDLAEKRLSLDVLDASWDAPRVLRFVEHVAHHRAGFGVEDRVALEVDGTVRFVGRIKRLELDGRPNAERVGYLAFGPRGLARAVTVRDPNYGFPRVVFNAPPDDDDYDAALSGLTVGEMIAWLFAGHADELRAQGVIGPAPAAGFVQAELNALTVVPPKVVLDGQDFDAALTALLAFQRGHRLAVDPATLTFRFRQIAALPTTTLTYNSADKPLASLLRPSTEGRATAVEITGPMRPVNTAVFLSNGGLTKLWASGYEADWTWAKGFDPANDATYGYVYRRFRITDADRRRMAHSLAEPTALGEQVRPRCPQVYRRTAGQSWAWVPSLFDFAHGVILLAQPATVGDEDTEGAARCADDIALVYAYLTDPLSARAPASGYEGTAFTEPDNPVVAVRRLYDEDFILPAQQPAYAAWARQWLDASKDILYAGTVTLGRLDWALADLDRRLHFTGQDDAGEPVATGFEALGAVMQAVRYAFAERRTELTLSTDLAPFIGRPPGEWATQARRSERYRSLHACAQAPTPRAGNDGEPGSPPSARGVHSLRRTEDSESGRVAGHIDLESGDGISIVRQVGADRNGFKISASGAASPGQWYWFVECLDCLGAESWAEGDSGDLAHTITFGHLWRWFPVAAGKVRRVVVLLESALGCESVFAFRPVKQVRGDGSPCPDTPVSFDAAFEANVDAEGNTALSAEFTDAMFDAATEPPVLADGDWLGCRVVLKARDPGGVTLGPDPLVTVGVYLEAA